MDGRHLLIKMFNEEDYAKVFAKQTLLIAGTPMKLLKWTPGFDPSKEPLFFPIWIKFPNLPIQYYHQNVLFNIGRVLGYPLKVDAPTYNLARLAGARVLVERDVTLPEIKMVWIGTPEEGFWQSINMEQKPIFCPNCSMFGHNVDKCYRLHPPTRKIALKSMPTQGESTETLGKDSRKTNEQAAINGETDMAICPKIPSIIEEVNEINTPTKK
ncbi:uncharacterized protein LOC110038294 [Phalaenopsis equestris]|uniref:uncharacterized protein LOC110038294 n=1 Tax=Phalaenopsis equestris TaxID=78828 RepID=UPI0009E24872|nr:uncharacterized protein LOC110038294 [Phalaenopsis equestris]